MKKSVYAAVALVWLLACGTAASAAAAETATEQPSEAIHTTVEPTQRQSKRVAVIPLIDRTGGWLSKRGAARLMDRMDQEFHIPLNETMHWVEFVNEDEAAEALREALSAQGRKQTPELAARDAAKTLDADLVLFMVMERCYQHIFHSFWWDGETYIESAAALTVYGYDRRHDRLIRVPASRFERTDYHPAYEAEELAMEALDEALREAHAKDAIFPLAENEAPAPKSAAGNTEMKKGEL